MFLILSINYVLQHNPHYVVLKVMGGYMKINMATDYALRIIRVIYLEDIEIVTSKLISERENISQGVVMKILKILKENHIVASHQGRGQNVGGFSLEAHVEELTLYDILTAMEGEVNFTFSRKIQCYEIQGKECSINKELYRINSNLIRDMKKKSLYEIYEGKKKEAVV